MATTHGSLENEIMNAVWSLEESAEDCDSLSISVSDVSDFINSFATSEFSQSLLTEGLSYS